MEDDEMNRSLSGLALGLAIGIFLMTGCATKLVSTKLPDHADPNREEMKGLVYSLPRTVIRVTLPVVLVETKKGPYSDFRKLFLPGLQEAELGRKLTLKRPTLSTFGEADPNQIYIAQIRGKRTLNQALNFQFLEDGAVTGLKADVTDTTSDVVLSAIGAVVGLWTRQMTGFRDGSIITSRCPEALSRFLGTEELKFNCERLEETEQKKLVAILEKREDPYRALLEARAAYQRLVELDRGRHQALSDPRVAGDFPYEKNLQATKDLTALFAGLRNEVPWEGIFEIRPERCDSDSCTPCDPDPLMRYVEQGICDTMDLRGALPPPDVMKVKQEECLNPSEVKLRLELEPHQLATELRETFTKPREAALFFNVPAQVRARLSTGARELGAAPLLIAQRGIVTALPSRLGGKSVTHDLKIFSSTGALSSYNLVSAPALASGLVDSLSSSANTLLDARNKQAAADKLERDKLTQLERDLKILDATAKLKLLCETLGVPEDKCPI